MLIMTECFMLDLILIEVHLFHMWHQNYTIKNSYLPEFIVMNIILSLLQ